MPLPSTFSEEHAYLGVFLFKHGVRIFLRHQPCEFPALAFVFHEYTRRRPQIMIQEICYGLHAMSCHACTHVDQLDKPQYVQSTNLQLKATWDRHAGQACAQIQQ
ncbi:hypothetical protein VNO77_44279 [Canavalia gladiata]|uniref:Uncharacterized protein n=1 Tax=Canavalia gladiata TaxID=3824 RepID=A0AAN9JY86_CANGL